jgi:hypothetical protein
MGKQKRVMQFNMRQDQAYKYVGYEYVGGDNYDIRFCDNCGRHITNLYFIDGQTDNKNYCVGSECVVTLTQLLNPSDFEEAKRIMKKEIKYIKWLQKECTYAMKETYTREGVDYTTIRLFAKKPNKNYFQQWSYQIRDTEEGRKSFDKFFTGKYITLDEISDEILERYKHNVINAIPSEIEMIEHTQSYALIYSKGEGNKLFTTEKDIMDKYKPLYVTYYINGIYYHYMFCADNYPDYDGYHLEYYITSDLDWALGVKLKIRKGI